MVTPLRRRLILAPFAALAALANAISPKLGALSAMTGRGRSDCLGAITNAPHTVAEVKSRLRAITLHRATIPTILGDGGKRSYSVIPALVAAMSM